MKSNDAPLAHSINFECTLALQVADAWKQSFSYVVGVMDSVEVKYRVQMVWVRQADKVRHCVLACCCGVHARDLDD